MGWYYIWLAALSVLLVFSSPRDRGALWVLLVAGVASKLLMLSLHGLTAPWKLVFPASVEVLTILALLTWAKNPLPQVGLLVIAWATHLLCYFDLMTGSNVVYDSYSLILGAVAVGQILACHDTFRHNFVALRDALLRMGRRGDLHPASGHASVLRDEGREGVSPL